MSALFESNRNLYHTFSRVAIQEGQGVAAAVNKTGHTVTTNDVWADVDKLPKNTTYFGNAGAAFTDLKAVYDKNSTEFSKYVKLYENATLTPVSGSGQDAGKNQAWELLVDGKRVKNFVAPTDVFDADGKPCNGYTLHLYDAKGTEVAPTDGNWAFDYVAGLVIFERGKTPQDKAWPGSVALGETLKLTAWAYVGSYLTDNLNSLTNNRMAVKPFKWNAETYMTYIYKVVEAPVLKEGETSTENPKQLGYYEKIVTIENKQVYQLTADLSRIENKTYYVQTSDKQVIIPAILFNVFNTATGLAFGDIEYQSDGSTRVVFEDWDKADFGDDTDFIGYGFVLGNGSKITMLTLEELKNESSSSSASE